ncbi:hypothetical protein OPKNFCMD_2408 [Methylobacterium crusticola]|uniref:DUF4336 domain-containing protein n=1 Tax=Methylobacterium crusticola TaxID=1697972 RepID=A0ABQ4QY75_9HYPH|nr:DUF4336 domain-containing protein [Methylobacterium crusticola]GJD49675.1 hypothetical protein OPKNFCMD_2408 [Methylobacterium crusticola]
MSTVTYPPLDVLKPVGPDLWIVDSGPVRALGLPLPVRMTVIRLGGGDVWLHSPTRYDPGLHAAIEAIGPIRHLVAPNVAHCTFLEGWQRHCPGAVTWAAPGLRERRPLRRRAGRDAPRLDRDLADAAPPDWSGDLRQVVVRGGLGFREVAFYHPRSRSLVLTDLIVNLEPGRLPAPMRPLARLAGVSAPDGRAPAYLRVVVRLRRREAVLAARALVALEPERVLFSHGAWFARDGAARLRRSLRWLLD